jgi:hypothetical protein
VQVVQNYLGTVVDFLEILSNALNFTVSSPIPLPKSCICQALDLGSSSTRCEGSLLLFSTIFCHFPSVSDIRCCTNEVHYSDAGLGK